MENYSYESISPLSDTLFTNEQNPDLGFSTKPQAPLKKHDSWSKTKKQKNDFFLEGYVEDDLVRSKSLTDEDLDELKGCFDLGFGGFSYDEIPELCNTLPALELCYSMSQKFLEKSPENEEEVVVSPPTHGPIANWKISSPGDSPEEVKARLKYWAQAVACTVRLCN
nr:hypothetical protein [Tanacetum cinerariifolium]